MKKIINVSALVAIAAAFIASCAPAVVSNERPTGWTDDGNTYRVLVTGYAAEDDDRKWKTTARYAAEAEAKATIMEQLVGSYVEATTAIEDAELIGRVVRQTSEGVVLGVNTVSIEDEDEDAKSVTIVAELSADGLRDMVTKRIEQYLDELVAEGVIDPVERRTGNQ